MNFELAAYIILAILSLIALGLSVIASRDADGVRARVDQLEREIRGAAVAQAGPAEGAPAAVPSPTAAQEPSAAAEDVAAAAAQAPAPARQRLDSTRLEQLIGGIWLQNLGSVLLLLGTFFLILWGYTQGKIGPAVLILAGVAFGIALAWRGDRLSRTIRPLGHALFGAGLGVVYITLYVGHFQMAVLPGWAAFALLPLLSFFTVNAGLRRRQPVIAGLGIVGAFVPLLMTSLSAPGFHLTPRALLGYFAVVNAVVFALTAARGWSGLDLLALILTSLAWATNTQGLVWGLPIQIGLSALFTALGMAPVLRLARSPDPIRRMDLAVVALAPIFLLVESLPYFTATRAATSGWILTGLGLLNLAAALWVDARRSERDLWRPLTGAATIFLTAALERLLANENLSLAWCVEGAVLVWLGLAPRGGWLRGLGYGVSFLAVLRLLYSYGSYDPMAGGGVGILNGTALRDLACIAIFLVVSDRIGRRREALSSRERHAPGVWLFVANALLMTWFIREAQYVARLLVEPGRSVPLAAPGHPSPASPGARAATMPVAALAWAIQSAVLVFLAPARRSATLRHAGYAVGVFAFLAYMRALSERNLWTSSDLPILYPAGILTLLCVVVLMLTAWHLRARRSELSKGERSLTGVAVLLANLALFFWTGREAWHVASALTPGRSLPPDVRDATAMLAAVIMSAAWILQAGALLALGWVRRSPLFRWLGLGLVGITVLKFLLLDLQRVDVFWRFVSALGVGAALLIFSFIYQRRARSEEVA